MKKYIFVIAIVSLLSLIPQLTAEAFPPPQPTPIKQTVISTSTPYVRPDQGYNRIIIQSGDNVYTTISPKHPKQSYVYKDFAAPQKYPHRNYYIPSYCMHQRYIYNDSFHPFCGRYRQFGNGMYINF